MLFININMGEGVYRKIRKPECESVDEFLIKKYTGFSNYRQDGNFLSKESIFFRKTCVVGYDGGENCEEKSYHVFVAATVRSSGCVLLLGQHFSLFARWGKKIPFPRFAVNYTVELVFSVAQGGRKISCF